MSNYPHSSSLATSLSTSPYAVQSNLENLINRSRTHPHPHTYIHPPAPGSSRETSEIQRLPRSRRGSEYAPPTVPPTIPESLPDDGIAILLGDDDDESNDRHPGQPSASGSSRPGRSEIPERDDDSNERSGILRRGSRRSTRDISYGTLSAPIRDKNLVPRNPSVGGSSGNSRSRSKARSPPREVKRRQHDISGSPNDERDVHTSTERGRGDEERGRGRDMGTRRLSHASPISVTTPLLKRGRDLSEDSRWGGSGGVNGAIGVGGILGTSGMGNGGAGMGLDPAEELDAEDLELPLGDDGRESQDWIKALKAEIPILLRSGVPVLFTQFAEWSLVLAAVISIGHLGTTDLAASSLASMTASVSSFSILQGLATALDTLLPAAWTSPEPSRVGLWTQRMSVVMLVSMIPMVVLWWNIEGILLSLGQEKEVAYQAGRYLRYLSFGIPGYGGNVVIKKYLQCQNLMHVPTVVLFIVAPINLILNWLLVWGPQSVRLGFVGGAVATAVSYTLIFVLNLGYALFWGPKEALYPFKLSHIFSKLGTVTSLGLAGTIMLSSEWWAWEACALAASLLGPVSLAAQSVLLSTCSTFYQIPASLGIASAVRVGNLLGAGRGWEAKWASRASFLLSVVFALLNSLICVIFRKNWGYLFNNDPEVVNLVASIMPYVALFQVADGVAAISGSVLRSLGLHTTGALINLTSYYIIGLPFGLWLTFEPRFGAGLAGLWIGLSIALLYGSGASLWLVWRADWDRAVERVRERLGLGPAEGKVDDVVQGEGELRL